MTLPVNSAPESSSCQSIVYLTIEYCQADLFSGNGVCARSQVRQLIKKSNVHVICGRPKPQRENDEQLKNLTITPVFLDSWYSTDRASSHEQFATGAARILEQLPWDAYDMIMAVDWTGTNAIRKMDLREMTKKPILYLNFRSYMSMTNISDADRLFYTRVEKEAVKMALDSQGGVVSLCDADDKLLKSLAEDVGNSPKFCIDRFKVFLPMLRREFSNIARHDQGSILNTDRKRIYLTCLVRLSEDKGAHRFVQLLRRLQSEDPDIWTRTGITPLLLGAPSQPEYAQRIRSDLQDAVPNAVVMDAFLSPDSLAEVLQQAALNIHPALYEAYGLTIVEAAAMGCPSIIHRSGIGASQLLKPELNASFAVDMENESELAQSVRKLIVDDNLRNSLMLQAFTQAISWTEAEYVNSLFTFANQLLDKARGDDEKHRLELIKIK